MTSFSGVFSYFLIWMVKNIPGLVQAWLGIFGVLGGPVLGLYSLGSLTAKNVYPFVNHLILLQECLYRSQIPSGH